MLSCICLWLAYSQCVTFTVVPDFSSGKFGIWPCFGNPDKSGCSQISSRSWQMPVQLRYIPLITKITQLTGKRYCQSGPDWYQIILSIRGPGQVKMRGGYTDRFRGVYSIEAWTQPASLEKQGGNENHAYFRENWGVEKLKGEERLNYLNTYLHCFPLILSKIFSLAPLARLHFIFTPHSGDTEHIRQGR